jgi:hypothetical protein
MNLVRGYWEVVRVSMDTVKILNCLPAEFEPAAK